MDPAEGNLLHVPLFTFLGEQFLGGGGRVVASEKLVYQCTVPPLISP